MASTVWKGHLTFGLVSFPVRLYSAARSESISFNQLHKHDGSRVRQVLYCQAEDKPIPRSEIVKGFEYEKDRYVVIEDEEVKKVAPLTAKVMEILEFVKPQLAKQGVELEVKVFTDYVQPNVQVAEKRLDANFFQHKPYLNEFNKGKGTSLVPVVAVHVEPFGAYSTKHKSLAELPKGGTVALPNAAIDRSEEHTSELQSH